MQQTQSMGTLQVAIGTRYGVDPQVVRAMKIECAVKDITTGELINQLWAEHEQASNAKTRVSPAG